MPRTTRCFWPTPSSSGWLPWRSATPASASLSRRKAKHAGTIHVTDINRQIEVAGDQIEALRLPKTANKALLKQRENTEAGCAKLREELEEIHDFRKFVQERLVRLDIDNVGTG
ncbi:MAG: hypothetical protein M0Z73_10130 [Betaproteobacteria bacterium]|nr:hypothetical protein [Betaproteobacteria bacterium]